MFDNEYQMQCRLRLMWMPLVLQVCGHEIKWTGQFRILTSKRHERKSQGITKVVTVQPEWGKNVWEKCQDNPFMRHFSFNQKCQAADGKEGRVKRSSKKLGCIEMVLVTICLANIELFTKYVNTLSCWWWKRESQEINKDTGVTLIKIQWVY